MSESLYLSFRIPVLVGERLLEWAVYESEGFGTCFPALAEQIVEGLSFFRRDALLRIPEDHVLLLQLWRVVCQGAHKRGNHHSEGKRWKGFKTELAVGIRLAKMSPLERLAAESY
jgi:hypothetical protein